MNNPKIGLIILDGWGIGDKSSSDAVYQAKTPTMDYLLNNYPNAELVTFGEEVGLPEGQMGNSEVGHLNIGAGRIVYQELTRINKSIREGELKKNTQLLNAFNLVKSNGVKLHFIGLVSEGGVHSSQAHLHALCDLAQKQGIENFYVHAFTDGRDCDPKSGLSYIKELEAKLNQTGGKLATVTGRYYAMDRDNRWERIQLAYNAMVKNEGEFIDNWSYAILQNYENGITDEFIKPLIHSTNAAKIEPKDVVISFNFRTDRPREISQALTQQSFPEYNMEPLDLHYFTMTNYDKSFKNVEVIFNKDLLTNTLGEVLSNMGKKQLRIAETEKYPHVTFFFNGGREKEFNREDRILVPSPKVATYDLKPEMSAPEITEKLLSYIPLQQPDFFCLNFANPDMVGHTGVHSAIVKAVETVDQCLDQIVELAKNESYELLIIADHGNADKTQNEDGSPHTAHTLNPVPVILFTTSALKLKNGKLADVAPTLLNRLRIAAPLEMTGESLIEI